MQVAMVRYLKEAEHRFHIVHGSSYNCDVTGRLWHHLLQLVDVEPATR